MQFFCNFNFIFKNKTNFQQMTSNFISLDAENLSIRGKNISSQDGFTLEISSWQNCSSRSELTKIDTKMFWMQCKAIKWNLQVDLRSLDSFWFLVWERDMLEQLRDVGSERRDLKTERKARVYVVRTLYVFGVGRPQRVRLSVWCVRVWELRYLSIQPIELKN